MDNSSITRRAVAAGIAVAPVEAVAARGPLVTLLGDSITAGLGLPMSAALPTQLNRALRDLGRDAVVRGAGISGDTTAGGLARVDRSVPPGTEVCVVALGANDLLQGVDPRRSEANLDRILQRLRARRITPVLAGIQAPPEVGAYARAFNDIFPRLARKHQVRLYPNLLRGVLGVSALNQPDGIHPNARGVLVIANGLAPVVAEAIRTRQGA